MIKAQVKMQAGPRILTVYIYLNDVQKGGGTNFEELDVTVLPKRGRVLIWPSVYDQSVNEKDRRTMHAAMPVEAGIKYGANAWFHLRSKFSEK
jgi:prolyl 4-hydroxylase